ncbi:MAG: hypothetical protein HY369_04975 [Candidatus Aenigmarchaeota archaeon]|nr:hypothetical protein [Candidatus Aenigmarchaeota archaeon]
MHPPCPTCNAKQVVYRGYRYNRKTRKRLRLCTACGRKFTPDDGFFRMRFSPKEITKAVALYKKGFSLAEVKVRMEQDDVKVSRWTILRWSRKYHLRKGV